MRELGETIASWIGFLAIALLVPAAIGWFLLENFGPLVAGVFAAITIINLLGILVYGIVSRD